MKKIMLIFITGLSPLIISCKKDIDQTPNPDVTTMDDLKVSSDFNWKTYRDVLLEVTGPANGIISVLATDGKVYRKAYLSQGVPYQMKLSVAGNEKTVQLNYMGQAVTLNIDSDQITYVFE